MLSNLAVGETDLVTDVAIVGSGPAGLTLAFELERRGLRSLVLESGDEPYALRWGVSSNAIKEADHGVGKPYLDLHLQRALGGGINVWGGWCATLQDRNFEHVESTSYSGWPLTRNDLLQHYRRAYELLEITTPSAYVLDPPKTLASAPEIATFGYALSPVRGIPAHWIDKLKNSGAIDLRTNATVVGIDAENGKVSGLRGNAGDNSPFIVRAKRYVLAGGACLNALLLKENLTKLMPDPIRADQVGKNLADHPYIYNRGRAFIKPEVEDEIEKSERWFGGFLSVTPTAHAPGALTHPDFHILLSKVEDDARWSDAQKIAAANYAQIFGRKPRLYSTIIGMEAVRAGSSVKLTPGSGNLVGTIELNISEAQQDLGLAALSWFKKNAATAFFEMAKQDEIVAVGHLMGTTRMETAVAPGVVDRNCRVIGPSNLYVLGSSVFPTTGFSNPTFTIVALASRLAEHLGEQKDAP